MATLLGATADVCAKSLVRLLRSMDTEDTTEVAAHAAKLPDATEQIKDYVWQVLSVDC